MLRVFKNLRKDVMPSKSRVLKYLLYAIGEIFLVVIGILIAVQVDNWNEGRKKEAAFQEIVLDIERDLEVDGEQYESLLDFHHNKDSLLMRVLRNQMTEQDYRRNWRPLRSLITTTITFYPHKSGYNALQQSLGDMPRAFKPIAEELTDYYVFTSSDADLGLLKHDEMVWENIASWEKYPWLSLSRIDTTVNEDQLHYLMSSQEYRGKAATFFAHTRNILQGLEVGHDRVKRLLEDIKKYKQDEGRN